MTLEEKIIHKLETVISVEYVDILDDTGKHIHHKNFTGGAHLSITIVSSDFDGKSLIERHRLVYKGLKPMIKNEIHALSLKTHTLDEWQKVKGNTDE